jgi:hypothetical protein
MLEMSRQPAPGSKQEQTKQTRAKQDHTPRLADRLALARRGRFVGREAELSLFQSALTAEEAPFAVLHIHGPGGVGKTTLLRAFRRMAEERGRPVVYLDGRNVEPSPTGFLVGLRETMGAQTSIPMGDLAALVSAWPTAGILLVDTSEALTVIDGWLRERFLPQLPAQSLVVMAGRKPPSAAWRTDVEWADLTRVLPLSNLTPEESRSFLAARSVPDEHHDEVLALTHGHPLALALVADAFRDAELLAAAVHGGLSGAQPMDEALTPYEQRRNALSIDSYRENLARVQFMPPPPDVQQILAALQ